MQGSAYSGVRRAVFILAGAAFVVLAPPVIADIRDAGTQSPPAASLTTLSGSYLAARVAGNLRDAPSAARFYRHALQRDPDNPTLLDRSLVLSLVAGQMDDAVSLASRIHEVDEGNRFARLALAVDAIRGGEFEDARRILALSGNDPLSALTGQLLEAWTLGGMGQTDAALEKVAGLSGPDWFEVFKAYHSALLAEVAGETDLAGEFYAQAYELDTRALRIVQGWSGHLARAGRTEQALTVLAEFSGVVPNHPLVLGAAGEIANGGVPEPIASDVREGAAEVLYGIGSALGSESGEEFAAIYLQLALHLAPDRPLAILSLADFYEKVEDSVRAVEAYERIPEDSPLRRNADVQRALNLNDLERVEEAREVLERLIEENPEDAGAIVALGNVLRSHEMFAEAAETYTLAIDQIEEPGPQHWSIYYFRGIAHERSKQWDLAEPDLKKALELNPEDPHVLNYLGYSWVDQGQRLDEALDMIARAVRLRPNDGYIVDSLGWAYYRLGRYEEAVSELERAVELRPEDPVINDHLGDAYWKVGRRLEARFQWYHARDLDPEPDELEGILEKIENGLAEEPNRAAAGLRRDDD